MSAFSDLIRSGFWRRVGAMIRKEFVQLRRDRITFATIVTIPLMQLVLFGYDIIYTTVCILLFQVILHAE